MVPTKTLSVRLTEQQYSSLAEQADKEGTTIGTLAKRRIMQDQGKIITPGLAVTLSGIYNVLSLDPMTWNKKMKLNVKEGLKKVFDYLQKN